MNADAAKWLMDYHKVFDLKSFGLTGKELVLGYDINNCETYEELSGLCKTLVVMDDLDFFNRWSKRLEVNRLCGDTNLPELVVCETVEEAIDEMKNARKGKIIGIVITDGDETFCNNFVNEWESEKMKKFDMVIGNPPYNLGKEHGVDLKIHKVLENMSEKIVFIHPGRFFLTHKPGVKPYGNLDMTKFESVRLFWGNGLFNIGLYTPVCISVWNNLKSDKYIEVIDDGYTNSVYRCKYDEVHIYGKLFPKLSLWVESLDFSRGQLGKKGSTSATTRHSFYLSTMRGTPPRGTETKVKDDFFTIVPKEEKEIEKHFVGKDYSSGKYKVTYSFSSAVERENFVNYLKTKTVRFILSLYKTANALCDGELNQIPWMDFTLSYSDKELRKLWNIDDKLWQFIDSHIPDYYYDYHFDGFYESK